jgi:hypothetical protein
MENISKMIMRVALAGVVFSAAACAPPTSDSGSTAGNLMGGGGTTGLGLKMPCQPDQCADPLECSYAYYTPYPSPVCVQSSTQVVASIFTTPWVPGSQTTVDAGITLTLEPDTHQGWLEPIDAKTDQNSQVTFPNVPPGRYYLQFLSNIGLPFNWGDANTDYFYVGDVGPSQVAPSLTLSLTS